MTQIEQQTVIDQTIGFFSYKECIAMNLAFFKALKTAVQRGGESKRNFTYGPKVDHTVLFPTKFPIQPTQSLMSSSAATCVNAAWGGEMPDRLITAPEGHRPKFR